MAKVEMTASGPLPYDGKQLRAGEHFEASERDAKILVATRKATYRTRQMTAANYETKVARSDKTLRLPDTKRRSVQ